MHNGWRSSRVPVAENQVWIDEHGRVFVAKRGCSELTTTILSEA